MKAIIKSKNQWIDMLLHNDCEPEESLDQITREASVLFSTPFVLINLLTSEHVVFKSAVGLTQGDIFDRSGSFCAATNETSKVYAVPNALEHPDFKNHPFVRGEPGVRSYIGKALHAPDGMRIGTLCMMDTKARTYTAEQVGAFSELATTAEEHLQTLLDPTNGGLLRFSNLASQPAN